MPRAARSFKFTVSAELGLMLDQLVSLSDLSEAAFIDSLVTFAISNEYKATVSGDDAGSWSPVLEAVHDAQDLMSRIIEVHRNERRFADVIEAQEEIIAALEYDGGQVR
jgi:hypothetical protein